MTMMTDQSAWPKVSATCEVWANGPGTECGKPTTHWYPAMGGGTMALCHDHAQKHLPYANAVALVAVPPHPDTERLDAIEQHQWHVSAGLERGSESRLGWHVGANQSWHFAPTLRAAIDAAFSSARAAPATQEPDTA